MFYIYSPRGNTLKNKSLEHYAAKDITLVFTGWSQIRCDIKKDAVKDI